MNEQQQCALTLRETDVPGAIKRFNGDEQLYISCLLLFLNDPTLEQLNKAIETKAWDDAFTAAHALKGLAGNMGFVPLMHSASQLLIIIRSGKTTDISEYAARVNSNYKAIINAIRDNFPQ